MDILLLIFKLFPMLIESIETIETSAPVANVGPEKAALLTNVVATTYKAAKVDPKVISQDQLLSLLQAITEEVVAFYNLIGIFKTSPPSTPAPVLTPAPAPVSSAS
jgi:hypothetical protein